MKASLEEVVTEARASGMIQITRQRTSDRHRQDQAMLLRICKKLPGGEAALEALSDDGHLPITTFLEEHLSAAEQYVIPFFMPPFAEELKRRKLAQAEALGEKPWIAESVGAWRIQYTERDRGLMEAQLHEVGWRQRLQRQLVKHKPAESAAPRSEAAGGFRAGCADQKVRAGCTGNVSSASLRSFFGSG